MCAGENLVLAIPIFRGGRSVGKLCDKLPHLNRNPKGFIQIYLDMFEQSNGKTRFKYAI